MIWLDSIIITNFIISKLASRVYASAPKNIGESVDERSILGVIGNIFER